MYLRLIFQFTFTYIFLNVEVIKLIGKSSIDIHIRRIAILIFPKPILEGKNVYKECLS